ncbi:MAG: UDP-N-acetylglucosamine diphosphorylase/glucosamine-1-phosphate N-acetyltransferase, partial [Actinobacteria bacterium]
GDVPLIRPETIARLVAERERTGAACVLLSFEFADPTGYGRVVRDGAGAVSAIIEHRDLPPEHERVRECNVGVYCFDAAALFEALRTVESHNDQGEYYLTDVVGILAAGGREVAALASDDAEESHGINDRVQLAHAAKLLQRRINTGHMLAGVTMTDPELVWVGPDVTIGRDVVLEPMTVLAGATSVADGAVIGPDSRVTDSQVGAGAVVDSSVVVGSTVGDGASVGPRAFLRAGTVLGARARVGTSVEIKKSRIGAGSKVPHLSYIGDAEIGDGVNVGAGSITCNYDGWDKHPTRIGDGAFIGSDTMLVAPVEVGAGSVTGAGSTISKDVPPGSLAVERTDVRIIDGWADKRRREHERDDAKDK